MQTLSSLVRDVEDAVLGGDAQKRLGMLRRMTDLFSLEAGRLNETQTVTFDEVMIRLSPTVPTKARIELSERLADLGLAPRKVVRDLAFDRSAEVAGPVLRRSALDERDLVQIAKERGQEHLFALSHRENLSESVTDVLVTRGDQKVVRSVAGNDGARFSPHGFTTLTDRARDDAVLEDTLKARSDLPSEQVARLAEASRERIAARLGNGGTVRSEASAMPGERRSGGDEAALAVAVAFVDGLKRPGGDLGFEEEDVLAWIREGHLFRAFAGIARVAGVSAQMALRAYRNEQQDPLLFLVRSARYGWGTYKTLLTTRPGPPLRIDAQNAAFEAFQALSVPTAQRVVRFTAVREQVQDTSGAQEPPRASDAA